MTFSQQQPLVLLLILFITIFTIIHPTRQQLDFGKLETPQNITVSGQSYSYISTRSFTHGYFRVSFSVYDFPVYFRIIQSKPDVSDIPEKIPNSFSDQGFDFLQYASVNKTFKFSPIGKKTRDFRFVLYNPAIGTLSLSHVQLDRLIYREEYGELKENGDRYAYLQSGDAEKLRCLSGLCLDSKKSVAVEIYPNYLTDSQYSSTVQNQFPIILDVYVMNTDAGYDSYGSLTLSDDTRRNRYKSVTINSKDDFKKVYFLMDSATDPVYIWISCSSNTYYGVCSIRFRVSVQNDDTPTTIGAIIGFVIGMLILITAFIVTIIVIVCCVKKHKKKANHSNINKDTQMVVTNGQHSASTSTLLKNFEKGVDSSMNSSFTTMNTSYTIDTYREPGDFPTMRSTMMNNSLISTNSSRSDNSQFTNLLNKRYEVLQKIGNGAFGVCYMCNDTKRNQNVAIKCIGMETSEQDKIFSELSKTATIQHEKLVQVFELFVSQEVNAFCLVMKYYGGDLEKYLKEYNQPLSDKAIVSLINQLGEGLDYLHSVKMFVHRDLKPKNIFVDVFNPEKDDIQVVIGDLGEAKELFGADNHSMRGTLAYIAPESLSGEKCGYALDIFALGVTFYQIIMNDISDVRISTQLLGQNEQDVLGKLRNSMLSKNSNEKLVDFIISMLRKDPTNRPSAADLKKFSLN